MVTDSGVLSIEVVIALVLSVAMGSTLNQRASIFQVSVNRLHGSSNAVLLQ